MMLPASLHLCLLCHLLGDYVLQSHAMAVKKTTSSTWATIHALFYGIPYAVLLAFYADNMMTGVVAWLIIVVTHGLINHYRIAAYWCRWWGVGEAGRVWPAEGVDEPPPFLKVWLMILVDNILHLSINTAVLIWVT